VSAQTQKVRAILARLRGALDPDCLAFLESGIAGGDEKLFNMYFNQLITSLAGAVDLTGHFPGPPINAATVTGSPAAVGLPFYINVNTEGAFFTAEQSVGLGSKLQTLQPMTLSAQFSILLHEIAHYFQADGYIQDDTGQGRQEQNNKTIWDKCKNTIRPGGA
jgi:hypothetical protein